MNVIMSSIRLAIVVLLLVCTSGTIQAQPPASGIPSVPLPTTAVVFDTAESQRIRVSVFSDGLIYPWGFTFLPSGNILVTERLGTLRLIRNGQVRDSPIAGVPEVFTEATLTGLMDVAVHPNYKNNRWVYLTYSKPTTTGSTVALARGAFDGASLVDVQDIFIADADGRGSGAASRLAFGLDGKLFMSVGGAFADRRLRAQDPSSHIGKILRLSDDGTVPEDNPFVGQVGAKPEVYSLGHRNPMGLAIHPETGLLWASEHGPQGGDEVNIILPGRNYGWPVVSYSREYHGPRVSEQPWQAHMEQPEIVWIPSIAPSGLLFYTGERFPSWQGDLFTGSMMVGKIDRTGHIERIQFTRQGLERRRESLLQPLRRRIRDIDLGPDGFLYALTAGKFVGRDPSEGEAALLRIEPID